MVFFTCNLCGESVKKPAVEKHYNTRCRGATKNVSCMDCQKDFIGEEYVVHTKCITEAEKYSGKDYVAKEQKNSGAKKQESWMEIVRSILESSEYNLTSGVRNAFQKLQNMDNVPRKQAKFQNFASNCLRVSKPLAAEMWKVLEKELDKMKAAKAQSNQTTSNKEQPEVNNKSEESTTAAEQNETVDKPKKKKRKHEESATNGEAAQEEESNETATIDKKKKKKRKHEEAAANETDESPSKAAKRETEVMNGNGLESPAEKKSKKEKKNKENETEANSTNEKVAKMFDWSSTLERIVSKYVEGIQIETLKKKLTRKYLSKLGLTELDEQQQKKFDKKFSKTLSKAPAVQVDGDMVRSC